MNERVIIFDTTLRDGEQSPGASMNAREKLRLAVQLEKLGIDVIEAGFPAASVGDFDAVSQIAGNLKKTEVAALARTSKADIDRAWHAIQHAAKPRIHTFIATSDIHLAYKLKMSRDEVLAAAVEAVTYAKSLTDNVEFSAEDGSRSDRDYLCKVFEAAIAAGATTINLPDTVGYAHSRRARRPGRLRHVPYPQYRPGGVEHPLPQRSRPGNGQHPRRHRCRRQAGRSDRQRHRGTGRQHVHGRGGHGDPHPAQSSAPDHRHRDQPYLRHQPAGQLDHRHHRAAQQGHCRGQCLCPRGRHPSGRHAEKSHDLRDHETGDHRSEPQQSGPGQTLGQACTEGTTERTGIRPERRGVEGRVHTVQGNCRQEKNTWWTKTWRSSSPRGCCAPRKSSNWTTCTSPAAPR